MREPRTTYRGNFKHLLTDIIFLVISAVISGSDNWEDIELFGKNQIEWLKKYISLKNGIPSHDTISRVFAAIDYKEFSECFIEWIKTISHLSKGEVIAIDGKRMCGSEDKFKGIKAIHMVSAFATTNGVCLGQLDCNQKSNEITAIPQLLNLLAIKGCVITIDAIGCQTKIANQIIEKEADYILAVKQNQDELYQQTIKLFEITKPNSLFEATEVDHGRVETRKCSVITDLRFFDDCERWKNLNSIIKIESTRYIKSSGIEQKDVRYYISSLNEKADIFNSKIRSHWHVENKLHWVLDVVFNEDKSRKRKGNSAKNFNIISKIALTLLDKSVDIKKISKKGKRYMAALNTEYREILLQI